MIEIIFWYAVNLFRVLILFLMYQFFVSGPMLHLLIAWNSSLKTFIRLSFSTYVPFFWWIAEVQTVGTSHKFNEYVEFDKQRSSLIHFSQKLFSLPILMLDI